MWKRHSRKCGIVSLLAVGGKLQHDIYVDFGYRKLINIHQYKSATQQKLNSDKEPGTKKATSAAFDRKGK